MEGRKRLRGRLSFNPTSGVVNGSGRFGPISRVLGQDPGHTRKSPEKKPLNYSNDYGMQNITSTVPQACPRSSDTAPKDSTSVSRQASGSVKKNEPFLVLL
jgi:hypothetical protein